MIHLSKSVLYLDDIKQQVFYFLLPKSPSEPLRINVSNIIHETYEQWMLSKCCKDLFLDAVNKKYTFIDAKVDNYRTFTNRYGWLSRDLTISFLSMSFGFNKRNA